MFKDFPGLCKEQTSQTEADKFFKIDIANKCTHQGLLLVFRTRDRFARVCRLNHVGRIVEKNVKKGERYSQCLVPARHKSLPVFCMGRKTRGAAPDASVLRSRSVERILLHQLNILEEIICRQSRAELNRKKKIRLKIISKKLTNLAVLQ